MCYTQAYHTAADRLQLIPVSGKYAGGMQFEIRLDRAGATASDIITVDLKVSGVRTPEHRLWLYTHHPTLS